MFEGQVYIIEKERLWQFVSYSLCVFLFLQQDFLPVEAWKWNNDYAIQFRFCGFTSRFLNLLYSKVHFDILNSNLNSNLNSDY